MSSVDRPSNRHPAPLIQAQGDVVMAARLYRECCEGKGLTAGETEAARKHLWAAQDRLAELGRAMARQMDRLERGEACRDPMMPPEPRL